MRKQGLRERTVVTDILCDICNKSVISDFHKKVITNFDDFEEYAQLVARFGYGSKRDSERFNFDFCESCFDKILVKIDELKESNN